MTFAQNAGGLTTPLPLSSPLKRIPEERGPFARSEHSGDGSSFAPSAPLR